MKAPKPPKQPPERDGGPESIMPGERSGEGSHDLFKHIVRDEQRKAGLPRSRPGKPPEEPAKPEE
ncbi:MAG: hypothetical protein EOO30_11775 [Comamonadaceae bacterium]|nr:MAG: hypothetical protein EOO30_11775 [Comamonadaceae bacterium]